jgi:methionyl-tRNA formyltransferase
MHSRFAYFGTPYVARDTLAALVAAGYEPEVVLTSPDAPKGRGQAVTPCDTKAWAEERELPVLTPASLDDAFCSSLASYDCDYGIAVAYGKIIPQKVLDLFPKGILNVHYSLLPRYRGASPVERALWSDDKVTGVTIQKMALELDAGDILAQREVPILSDDTTLTLRPRLIEEGARLLIETLPAYLAGDIAPAAQDPAQATRAPKIRKEEGRLLLSEDGRKNWNTYRALRESPGTYFFAHKDGKQMRFKVTRASFENGTFAIERVIPEGKGEQDYSYLASNGWMPD